MLAQIVAHVLQVMIAAGLVFQLATLARLARNRYAARTRVRPATPKVAPPKIQRKARRCRDYRLALRLARASVSA